MSANPEPIIDHLFRHESGKLIAVLTNVFGTQNLELVEDVVQDTLLQALDHWKFHGVPKNPSGWLFTAARNKALDVLRRNRHQKEFIAELSPLLASEYSAEITLQKLLNAHDIEDEQLRMMFVCCHPTIPEEAQIALVLKTLCGFSTAEIARAFLTSEETITKRLYRARQQFRVDKIPFMLPEKNDVRERLGRVLTAVYLIFNEGYNSTQHDSLIREDLIEESLRLGRILVEHPFTNLPEANALLALLCFQASRLYGRVDGSGNLLQLKEQDRTKWNRPLIEKGIHYLQCASTGENISPYHAEAAIAHEHCIAPRYEATNWSRILILYDWLYQTKPDPIVAMNRVIALAEVEGSAKALEVMKNIPDRDLLSTYYLFHATLGELHFRNGDTRAAKANFQRALDLTPSTIEKELLRKKIAAC